MNVNQASTSRFMQTSLAVLFVAFILLSINKVKADEPANIVEARQQKLKEMGKSMKTINEQLKSSESDIIVIQQAADLLSAHAKELENWFPAGTGQDAALDTDALPEIWQQKEKFSLSAQELVKTSDLLAQLAQKGQLAELPKQLKEVKDSCSACHKNFRAD